MRMLVTGGAGFIGSNLVHQLASAGHEVVVADDFSSAHWSNLIGFRGDVMTLDIADGVLPLARFSRARRYFTRLRSRIQPSSISGK